MNRPEIFQALSNVGPDDPPETFVAFYESVLAASSDPDILSRLMFTAGMYLDRHPGVLRLPRGTAEKFLASKDFDELLAGLKAIRHSTATTGEIIAHYLTVMKRDASQERNAALYQLGQFICDCDASVVPVIDPSVLTELDSLLFHMAVHAQDVLVRDMASRCSATLRSFS